MARFPQAEDTILLCTILLYTIFLCTKGTNDTISASGGHDAYLARKARYPQAEYTIFLARFLSCTKGTISASGGHDFSCTILLFTKGTNNTISASGGHDFSFVPFVHKNRAVDLSTSYHSCFSCIKYRAVDLSTSYHSCLSCI